MKDKILKLIELRKEAEPLEKELDDHVRSVAVRWAKADDLQSGCHSHPSDVKYIDSWKVDGDSLITVLWDETWPLGGHDSGVFYFHSKYLYDESLLVEFERTATEISQARSRLDKEKKRLADLKAYEALRVKLNMPR
jgi:hypothetical protein